MKVEVDLIDRLVTKIDEMISAKQKSELGKLLTPEQVAEKLQVDVSWVYRHKKQLGCVSLPGSVVRFDADILEKLLKQPKGVKPTKPVNVAKQPIRKGDLWQR